MWHRIIRRYCMLPGNQLGSKNMMAMTMKTTTGKQYTLHCMRVKCTNDCFNQNMRSIEWIKSICLRFCTSTHRISIPFQPNFIYFSFFRSELNYFILLFIRPDLTDTAEHNRASFLFIFLLTNIDDIMELHSIVP